MSDVPMGPRPAVTRAEIEYPGEYRIVIVPEALRPHLEEWLAARGLEMRRSPMGWLITPTEEALRTMTPVVEP